MLNVKSTDTLIEVCEAEQQQQDCVECVVRPALKKQQSPHGEENTRSSLLI